MLSANPLGVGPGNFFQDIGNYPPENPQGNVPNTFLRRAHQLRVPGVNRLPALFVNAISSLPRTRTRGATLPSQQQGRIILVAYGIAVPPITNICCSLTMTLLYVESPWWPFALPAGLERVLDKIQATYPVAPVVTSRQLATRELIRPSSSSAPSQ